MKTLTPCSAPYRNLRYRHSVREGVAVPSHHWRHEVGALGRPTLGQSGRDHGAITQGRRRDDQNTGLKSAALVAYGALLMASRETQELEPVARQLGQALGLETADDALGYDGRRNRIREIRLAKGLSLADLAEPVGTSAPQISRLELGQRRLDLPWMHKLSTALDCQIPDLLVKGETR